MFDFISDLIPLGVEIEKRKMDVMWEKERFWMDQEKVTWCISSQSKPRNIRSQRKVVESWLNSTFQHPFPMFRHAVRVEFHMKTIYDSFLLQSNYS